MRGEPRPSEPAGRGGFGGPGVGGEVTPIVVNGVMYVPAGNRVAALDAETGKEIWRYALPTGTASSRGVGYWPGDGDNPPRVLFISGVNLIALNATTGKLDPEDTTPEHAKACQELVAKSGGFYNAGPFTPFLLQEEGAPPKSTVIFPGPTGGTNWGGMATDPKSGYVFAYTQDLGQVGWTEKRKPGVTYSFDTRGSDLPYERAAVDGPGPFHTFSVPVKEAGGRTINWPCQKPPWGRLNAVNANTDEIAWRVPLGITDELPEAQRHTGRSVDAFSGPMTTAGGLVFIGAVNDNRFRAFDSKTGKEQWVFQMAATGNANPMTYQVKNGKQYVAIVAGDTLNVFTLP